ncbi:hypothetical protein [Helicobacter sp.]|nr:hypothetical protein [Helicobacter sp.]MBD5165360.1 hypothetical protein [Helicobacter sp.]
MNVLNYGLLRRYTPRNDAVAESQVCTIIDHFIALCASHNDAKPTTTSL